MSKPNIKRAVAGSGLPLEAKRGWHIETPERDGMKWRWAVRDGYHAERCEGEAHANPHIDHCMDCLSHVWGFIAVKDGES